MLLEDFLVAQTAGDVAVAWVDGSPDAARLPPLHGVEVRTDDVHARPVYLVRRDEIDRLLGHLGRRPAVSRLVVVTDVFLFEPVAQTLVTAITAAGCQILHAAEIDDPAKVDEFSAFALQRRSTPLPSTGPSVPGRLLDAWRSRPAGSGRAGPGSAGVRRPMASRAHACPGTGVMAGPTSCRAAASPRPHAGWRL